MKKIIKPHFLLKGWAGLTSFISPFIPLYLNSRCKKGKEIKNRLKERQGYASIAPFTTSPVQFHAASIGELISILPLMQKMHSYKPDQTFLVTTGTVTSFHIFQHYIEKHPSLGPFITHQFIPLDVPKWIDRFLNFWKPSLIVLVESELWPNFIQQAARHQIPIALINGRLSDQSVKIWEYFPKLTQTLLSNLNWITTQSAQDQSNFQRLGVKASFYGNLKQAAPNLTYDQKDLDILKQQFKGKPIWLAASTHATEERFIVQVHQKLRQKYPDLITIIVPRHPERSLSILNEIGSVARRSLKELPFDNGIWLCDTLGELGLFYRLTNIAFIGNSLESTPKGGGHNPFEAVTLNCAISTGPKRQNFTEAYETLKDSVTLISSEDSLYSWVDDMLSFPEKRKQITDQALNSLNQDQDFMNIIIQHLYALQKDNR